MKKSEYQELLGDIRWAEKRIRILSRDDFTCKWCRVVDRNERKDDGTPIVRLEVHHFEYPPPPLPPWEVPDRDLVTLCHHCHDTVMRSHNREVEVTGNREKERLARRDAIQAEAEDGVWLEEKSRTEDRERHSQFMEELSKCHCGFCVSDRQVSVNNKSQYRSVRQLTKDEYEARLAELKRQAATITKPKEESA